MIISLALTLAIAAGASPADELCHGTPNPIEPDMRILESDLTHSGAVAALERLRTMVDSGQLTGEFHHGALNQLKILQGFALLRQAQEDRSEFAHQSVEAMESTAILCNWLAREGFWYD